MFLILVGTIIIIIIIRNDHLTDSPFFMSSDCARCPRRCRNVPKIACGPENRLWWMYQHTVVSAAPACGVHVPIRSHVQALW
ncbi:BQ5605_C003g02107 [Microbotryum silenes-dioicae]|uniref:BQ5605_C003g02107 protein n=1 Tax=Microbotryum silenes-dioicae TaxID=796604 RepID=A0A2X0MMT3_9BASI|nr:BQ5605_C003g02107 [Microbotryum silenes-dioicae]